MSEEERWQGTLRVNLKNTQNEVRQLRSILSQIASRPRTDLAISLALDIGQNGLQGRSADDIRKLLADDPHIVSEEGLASGHGNQRQRRPVFETHPIEDSYLGGFRYPEAGTGGGQFSQVRHSPPAEVLN